ncbi:hypothetical protein WICPIJ_009600 [Wickerhamomyces pijperi]|uniref:PSP1 C-terminal domain-containing protein n=1 Tax=Wickerhamomyces pijperi TaxID=599730 RepID=A0A9P8PMT9_WICPI|nr:hypothetical protein WICPIJ_009600 [Wickerhamomyces pijperi]
MQIQHLVMPHPTSSNNVGYPSLIHDPININQINGSAAQQSPPATTGQQVRGNGNIWNPLFAQDPFSYQPVPATSNAMLAASAPFNHQQVTSPEQSEILMNKLNNISSPGAQLSPPSRFKNNHHNTQRRPSLPYDDNVFQLPLELQGGLSTINSRRPSFTAEQTFTSNYSYINNSMNMNINNNGNTLTTAMNRNNLELYAHSNNFNNTQFFNNSGGAYNQFDPFKNSTDLMNDFRSRRPSIQINPQAAIPLMPLQPQQQQQQSPNHNSAFRSIDNGLLLNAQNRIITSPELRAEYSKSCKYFSYESAKTLYQFMRSESLTNPNLIKVILNLKKLNNIFNLPNRLVLALTKSGKFELLSIPLTSTLLINEGDLVLCDGDRGKDLVYVLDPNLSLELAILINYLKKKLHAKSLNYFNDATGSEIQNPGLPTMSNTTVDLMNGLGILDEETQFQIPLKLVLRFANVQEVHNLKFKLIQEIKSLKTCILKISNNNDLKLRENLIIKNSEYQFDEKKLIFYYYSKGGQRLDFRLLIKELFKIYKTRIWLCATLNPTTNSNINSDHDYSWIHGVNINAVELEDFPTDDFHVLNLKQMYEELIGPLQYEGSSSSGLMVGSTVDSSAGFNGF